MTTIMKLQDWYAGECNGDWEHQYGLKIETLDNPGWLVDIDLRETVLADRPFEPVEIERSEDDWVHCFVKKQVFSGRGGSRNLDEILKTFLDWMKSVGSENTPDYE